MIQIVQALTIVWNLFCIPLYIIVDLYNYLQDGNSKL